MLELGDPVPVTGPLVAVPLDEMGWLWVCKTVVPFSVHKLVNVV